MTKSHGPYKISDAVERIDFPCVTAWLATTYWNAGISQVKVEYAASNSSMVVGAYLDDAQLGYLRVVSDKTTFAWLADVYVDEAHRKKGIATAMVRFAVEHPDYRTLNKWMLGTRDAHPVYAAAGFKALDKPQNVMILRMPE
jgi:GNAT superfamily N-acetyltransferase